MSSYMQELGTLGPSTLGFLTTLSPFSEKLEEVWCLNQVAAFLPCPLPASPLPESHPFLARFSRYVCSWEISQLCRPRP